MQTKTKRVFFNLLVVAGVSLTGLLTGCTLVEAQFNSESHYTKVGNPLSSFLNVRQIVLHQGRLILSDEDYKHPGIAVIDTSADTVVEFYPVQGGRYYSRPTTFAVIRDSLIVVGTQGEGARRINLHRKNIVSLPISMGRLRSSEGRAFRLGETTVDVRELEPEGFGFTMSAFVAAPVYSLAVSNGRVFAGSWFTPKIWISNANGPGSRDSLNLTTFTGDSTTRAYEMVSQGGRLFVHAFSRRADNSPDTNVVLVIRADSLTLEKTIRLGSNSYHEPAGMPNITDGVWYLSRYGGVEAMDLSTGAYLGRVVDGGLVGQGLLGFARTGANRGYALYAGYTGGGAVKRLSF